MESRYLPTVTVAIPAYNEEKNISFLLASILRQRGAFLLKKIIILSDGSSDKTDEIVRSYEKQHPYITLVADGRRLGKAQRLNQLYQMNTNEFLVVLDGDVVLSDTKVIGKLLKGFINEHVAFVGGNVTPVKPQTHLEHLINTWNELWFETQKDIHHGHTIHNVYGRIMALRKDFALSIHFPPGTISEPQYLYFMAKRQGLSFIFAKEAVVFFNPPTTVADYTKQYNRHVGEMRRNAQRFGNWVYDESIISRSLKIKAFGRMVLREPFWTPLAIGFHLWFSRMSDKKPSIERPGIWSSVPSTKRSLRIAAR